MTALLQLFIYALLGSAGVTLMKKAFMNGTPFPGVIKSPNLLIGIGLYAFSFLLWLKILKENDLSYAFPIASSAVFVLISLFSLYFLHEHVGFMRILGMAIILLGIIVVSRG
jgi:multidrug transporter EmrE-like cation transporter